MRRPIRSLSIALVALGGIIGTGLLIGKLYLASSGGGEQIAGRLEQIYGAPVQVGGVDVGLHHITLCNVRLFEAGSDDAQPWAVIDKVRTDLTPGDLLEGITSPRHLTLIGASITLRFDRQGTLLTRLPSSSAKTEEGELPEFAIRNGRVVLKQEGRPDFVVSAVEATVRHEGENLILSGSATAADWDEWSLTGLLVPESRQASLTFKRPEIHFSQAMLDELPLVPPSTWEEVRAEGDTSVELTVGIDPATGKGHYRVALQPRRCRVQVTAIDLKAEQVNGEVVLEDGHVRLRDVVGRTAEGNIRTSGDLDFRGTPEQLKFAVDVQALRLKRLPRSWSLPPLVDGKLTGHADLVVTLGEGKARTNGEGTGIVRDARIWGIPADPVRLKLVAKGRGFQFTPAAPEKKPGGDKKGQAGGVSPLLNHHRLIVQTGGLRPPLAPEPNYLETELGMTGADLTQLLRGLGVPLSMSLKGRITWHARVRIPLDTANDRKTYRVQGNASLPWLRIEDLELEDVQTRIDYRDGILRLEDLAGHLPGPMPMGGGPPQMGELAGNVRVGLVPANAVDARLTVEAVGLGRALSVLPGLAEHASGLVAGQAEVHAPLERLRDVAAWKVVGRLTSPRAQVFDWEVTDGRGNFHLEEGVLAGMDLGARVEGVPIAGAGRVRLTSPYSYEASGEIGDDKSTAGQRLARKLKAPVAVSGPFRLTAGVRGNLRPLTVFAEGTGAAPQLEVAGFPLKGVKFRWETDGRRLDVTGLRASLFGGETTGDAVVPLTAATTGRLALVFRDVEAGPLARKLAAMPLRLEGRLSGTAQANVAAVKPGMKREVTAALNVQSPTLRVQQIAAKSLSGNIGCGPDGIDYRLVGTALDGRLFLEGHVPPPGVPLAPSPHEGVLRLEGARLSRMWEALGTQSTMGSLHGRGDLEISFRHDRPDRLPDGTGRFILRGLRWDGTELAGAIRGGLALAGTKLRLMDLSGDLGEGELRGHASFDLGRRGQGWFSVALERVEAAKLLEPWPALRNRFGGPLDITLRGTLGADWTGSGEILLPRGTLFGVEAVNARLPFEFALAPSEGFGQIACREATTQLARGRVTARATYRWGGDSSLDTRLHFNGVQVQALLRSLGAEVGPIGTGQLNGRLDLGGTNIRSANDLTGSFTASLQQTQAQELPVVRQLLPFLAPGRSGTAIFTTGDLEARLARGILRIQRCRLIGPVLQMVIEGTATLQGRIDLDATANTSSPLHTGGAEMLSARVPAIGTIPIRLLAEATSLFAGRLMHLQVTGTWRSPVVRVAPIVSLTEEAVRFFLGLATRGASIIAKPGE